MAEMLLIGSLGLAEILIILLAVLLLFGAKRLPEIMRQFGQGLREFKKASTGAVDEMKRAVDETEASTGEKEEE